MQRKMNANIDLQDIDCMRRKDLKKKKQQKNHKNRMKKGRGTAKSNVGADKKQAGNWTTGGVKIMQ